MSKRDEYVLKLKSQLDQWNAEVARWESRAGEVQAGARTEYDRRLEAFRTQRDAALKELHQLQAAAGDAWIEMARGADEAWDRMREAFEKASTRFHQK